MNSLELLENFTNIDDKLIIDSKYYIRRNLYIKYGIFAACFVFLIAIGTLNFSNLAINNLNIENSLIATNTPIKNADENIGGVEYLGYTSVLKEDFLFIESRLVDYVGEDKFKEWSHKEFDSGLYETTVNVVGYIKKFNINKEEFTNISNSIEDLPLYTQEQIDMLYSSDINELFSLIKNQYAIVSNNKIYSPQWLATHTCKDYKTENIDKAELKRVLDKVVELSKLYDGDIISNAFIVNANKYLS